MARCEDALKVMGLRSVEQPPEQINDLWIVLDPMNIVAAHQIVVSTQEFKQCVTQQLRRHLVVCMEKSPQPHLALPREKRRQPPDDHIDAFALMKSMPEAMGRIADLIA